MYECRGVNQVFFVGVFLFFILRSFHYSSFASVTCQECHHSAHLFAVHVPDISLLYSHMGSVWHFSEDFTLEGWSFGKWATDLDICILTYSPLEFCASEDDSYLHTRIPPCMWNSHITAAVFFALVDEMDKNSLRLPAASLNACGQKNWYNL